MDQRPQPILPDIFADAVLDLHLEGGVFRLTLAQAMAPTAASTGDGTHQVTLAPKAVLLLTEPGFASLCQVVDGVRQQIAEQQASQEATSPNFGI